MKLEHRGDVLAEGSSPAAWPGAPAGWAHAPRLLVDHRRRTLKQWPWDEVGLASGPDGFTARYGREGGRVGVSPIHERDDACERGRRLVEAGAPPG